MLDCKTVVFFLKISQKIGKAWCKSPTRASLTRPSRSLFSALFQAFCLTSRVLTQKYGLFCSQVSCALDFKGNKIYIAISEKKELKKLINWYMAKHCI